MNANTLKPNDEVRITHARKGTFECKIISNGAEWLQVNVLEKVEGLVNTWLPGETLGVRKSLITKLEQL